MSDQNLPIVEYPEPGDAAEYPANGWNEGPIVIASEFADVVLRRVLKRDGVRLDLWSPSRGTRILLDAVALECLASQEPERITELLSTRDPLQ